MFHITKFGKFWDVKNTHTLGRFAAGINPQLVFDPKLVTNPQLVFCPQLVFG